MEEKTYGNDEHPLEYFRDMTRGEVLAVPGVGPKTADEIEAALADQAEERKDAAVVALEARQRAELEAIQARQEAERRALLEAPAESLAYVVDPHTGLVTQVRSS